MSISVCCEGWRDLPHSFSIAHQAQAAFLSDLTDVSVAVRDLPAFDDWIPMSDSIPLAWRCKLEALGPCSPTPDCIIRCSYPYDFRKPEGVRLLTMVTVQGAEIKGKDVVGGKELLDSLDDPLTKIITPSQWGYHRLCAQGVSGDKIVVVPLGFDPDIFHPPTLEARKLVREKLHLLPNEVVFLCVGAVSENKGVDLLLAAFARLIAEGAAVRLVLKGSDMLFNSRERLRKLLEQMPAGDRHAVAENLLYIGDVFPMEEMAALYGAADVYVAPYLAEGFNMPAMEAAACGLPLILTASGPTDDFTTPQFNRRIEARFDPDLGHLEPSSDSLLLEMRAATSEPDWRTTAGNEAAEYVFDRFTWAHVARRLADAFQSAFPG